MLAILIECTKNNGQISGLVPHLVDGGLSTLQHTNDTFLFMEYDLKKAKNLKLVLCAFEQLSGLKIYFHKSDLFCFEEAQEAEALYTNYLVVSVVSFLLGIWGSRYIIEGSQMLAGNMWKREWKGGSIVGKDSFCPPVEGLSLLSLHSATWFCTCCLSSKFQKGFCTDWTILDLDFSSIGKMGCYLLSKRVGWTRDSKP